MLLLEPQALAGASPAMRARMAKAVLAVAAADGRLSPSETGAFLARARMMGADEAAIAEALRFDAASARVEDLVDVTMRPLARRILYAGFHAARADGWDTRERDAARALCMRLGVEPQFVDALWSLYRVEHAVRGARLAFLWPDGAPPADLDLGQPTAPAEGSPAAHLRMERYGLEGPVAPELLARLGRLVLAVAAADAFVTPREMAWLASTYRALGATEDVIVDLAGFDGRNARVAELLDKRMRPFARLALYDACCVAAADDLHAEEQDRARVAAAHLGLAPSLVAQVEAVLALEAGFREALARLLAPPG